METRQQDRVLGRRILLIGSGGSGKSTLARQLGARTGLPVIHLDREFWRPGWVETPRTEWLARVEVLLREPEWIMDGNYGSTLGIRFAAADQVVFLDFPRLACLWGVGRRIARSWGRTRPDMADGCPEKLDLSFLRWIWMFPRRERVRILETMAEYPDRRVVVLKNRRAVRKWLMNTASRGV